MGSITVNNTRKWTKLNHCGKCPFSLYMSSLTLRISLEPFFVRPLLRASPHLCVFENLRFEFLKTHKAFCVYTSVFTVFWTVHTRPTKHMRKRLSTPGFPRPHFDNAAHARTVSAMLLPALFIIIFCAKTQKPGCARAMDKAVKKKLLGRKATKLLWWVDDEVQHFLKVTNEFEVEVNWSRCRVNMWTGTSSSWFSLSTFYRGTK